MSTEAPKPTEGAGAPGAGTTSGAPSSTSQATPTQTPDPREITMFVTNKQWECYIQEGAPYLENGYMKFIKGDENPHHWGQKRFVVFDAPGPGLIEVKAGDPVTQFWAHFKNDDRKLTLYFVCRKKHPHENRVIWFIFAPNYADERQVNRGGDFWGWEVVQKFYAKSKVDNWVCEQCTYLNTRVDDECEICKTTAPAERKSTPIKRAPVAMPRQPVMTRSISTDSEPGQQYGPQQAYNFKHGWWNCTSCAGENPPSISTCEYCGKEEYNPRLRPDLVSGKEDPSKKPVVKPGVSESFAVFSTTS